jgi:hypothetical protein
VITHRTLFAVPAYYHKAAALAIRDAEETRTLWQRHGQTRRLLARQMPTKQAKQIEQQVIRTADALIARGGRSR